MEESASSKLESQIQSVLVKLYDQIIEHEKNRNEKILQKLGLGINETFVIFNRFPIEFKDCFVNPYKNNNSDYIRRDDLIYLLEETTELEDSKNSENSENFWAQKEKGKIRYNYNKILRYLRDLRESDRDLKDFFEEMYENLANGKKFFWDKIFIQKFGKFFK